ncbi:hypothetical protein [Paraburkholderia sacchari]|uniref:hypothetical protein n=1 Tax=Paraburkholderia sacchari TaxID=159450 RepID=UPI001FD422D9|nr:hypothetical protein [Paraburkholderia sacchari]
MTPSSATSQDRAHAMHGRHARHGTRAMPETHEVHEQRAMPAMPEKRARQRRARTPTMRRHWRELVELALGADDIYAAAALYPHADHADRERLGARLFVARRDCLALAACAFAHGAVLAELARLAAANHDETLKMRLARNPATPGDALALFVDEHEAPARRLACLLARHAKAPHALLATLAAQSEDIEVLRALCENVGVPSELLTLVEQRGIAVLQRLLAIHLATDPQTLLQLWKSTHTGAVRAQVLRHPCCPDSLLHTLPSSSAERRSLALQTRAPAAILAQLARDEDPGVRRAAALNANTPAGALIGLCFDAQAIVRRVVATRRDLPLKVVEWLIGNDDPWVRRTLARNPACPAEWLERLVNDSEAEVRRAVARHPDCPARLVAQLAADPVAWVRAGVALREDLPGALLRRLAADEDVDVLSGIARHHATPQAQLARLAAHPVADVRRGVILNREASRRVLLQLRHEPYPLHRVLVFEHPNLTDADRWRMRFDPDREVRARLFGHFGRALGPLASSAAAPQPAAVSPHPLDDDAMQQEQHESDVQHVSPCPTNTMESR